MRNSRLFSGSLYSLLSNTNSNVVITKSFTLSAPANVSAQVVNSDGIVIRNLLSAQSYTAGTHLLYWNGMDDYQNEVTRANYTIKLIKSNVNYAWQGVIGNTSEDQTGGYMHKAYYHCMTGMTIVNGYAYFCTGYAENSNGVGKFALSDPQRKIFVFGQPTPYQKVSTVNTNFLCNDGTNVYWGAENFVYATKISDDSEVTFANGVSYTAYGNHTYNAIDLGATDVSGLTVQQSGSYIFVSHGAADELHVLDKSGNLIQNLAVTNPRHLCIDADDNLWMVSGTNTLAKYTVNSDGTLTSATIAITGLTDPRAIQVNGSNIYVTDAGSAQQLKTFNKSTGSLVHTKGGGNYGNDATVSDDKFYFSGQKDAYYATNDPKLVLQNFIAFEPDNSMWVNDPGNFRVQHYDSGYNLLNRVMSLGATYFVSVDRNNTARAWAGFLEFAVDTSVTLSGSSGWTFVRNWGEQVSMSYDQFQKFRDINTITHGGISKTFGLARNTTLGEEVVEFKSDNTLRFTGIAHGLEQSPFLSRTGDFFLFSTKYTLQGFDSSDNPIWGSAVNVLGNGITDPDGILSSPKGEFITSTGKVVFYQPSIFRDGDISNNAPGNLYKDYHLGAFDTGGNVFKWKQQLADTQRYEGYFVGPDAFELGGGVQNNAGNNVAVCGQNIITGYHGEFYKQAQTNIYNHYWDNGMVLGQFGTAGSQGGLGTYGSAGNVQIFSFVHGENSDTAYVWHGDEGYHGGMHCWKITGLDSIQELASVNVTYPSSVIMPPVLPGIDLLAGIPYSADLSGVITGWTFNPVNGITDAQSSRLSYQRDDIDITFHCADANPANFYYYNRDLGSNLELSLWKITGQFHYKGVEVEGGAMKQFLDVVDDAGKVIVRITDTFNYVDDLGNSYEVIYVNGQIILNGTNDEIGGLIYSFQPLEIAKVGSVINIKYAGQSLNVDIFESGANISNPKTLRPGFQGGYNPVGRGMGLKGLRFINS